MLLRMGSADRKQSRRAAAIDDTELYVELRRLAASYLRRERAGHTLQPTALVNEALVRLLDATRATSDADRATLKALATSFSSTGRQKGRS